MRRLLSRSQHPHEVARYAAELAGRYAADPEMRTTTLAAVMPHVQGDGRDEYGRAWPAALHAWARSIRHVREPAVLGELLLHPRRVVEFGAGDCDDIALAVATFAAHVGLPAAVMTIWTGDQSAHAVAVVGASWYGAPCLSVVIDPERAELVALSHPAYRYGRMFVANLARGRAA